MSAASTGAHVIFAADGDRQSCRRTERRAHHCGVNVARYRYVMSSRTRSDFDRDALLRVMTAALRDPANVIGASSHVERGRILLVGQHSRPGRTASLTGHCRTH
jgi:hypothetical protein